MAYFYEVELNANTGHSKTFFVIDRRKNPDTEPILTEEELNENNAFKLFKSNFKPKNIVVSVAAYSTRENFNAATADDIFREMIDNKTAERVNTHEFFVGNTSSIKHGKRKKILPKISQKAMAIICSVCILISLVTGILIGGSGDKKSVLRPENISNLQTDEDGLIIPNLPEIPENSDFITVTIDRSYCSVPTEDLQIKAEIIDGKASLTLPYFDPTDFFTHVFGYTWGFSSVQNAEKIEYYGGVSYDFTKDVKLYRTLVKYGGGNGTKDDPYLISYFDQLNLMSQEETKGYFRQICDINFPQNFGNLSINTVGELSENTENKIFEYDGGGFKISGITSPLFGKISGGKIKNVNVTNSEITSSEHKNFGVIASEIYNFRYTNSDGEIFETGETFIENCTVSHSSIILEKPVIYDKNGNVVTTVQTVPAETLPVISENTEENIQETTEISLSAEVQTALNPPENGEFAIGAITGLGGEISNCYVTDFGISNNLDENILYTGGISGKPANVKNCGVYYFAVQGNVFYAGGISGSGGGSRLYDAVGNALPNFYGGNIQGCFVRNFTAFNKRAAGGICGESTTDSDYALISNCYTMGLDFKVGIYEDENRTKCLKKGFTGGIIGVDGESKNGHFITNTVSISDFSVMGFLQKSRISGTVRTAPDYAFYQENILNILNSNAVNLDNPKEIFKGEFIFEDGKNADESENLPFPSQISELITKVESYTEEN